MTKEHKELVLKEIYALAKDCRCAAKDNMYHKDAISGSCPSSILGYERCVVNLNEWDGYYTPCSLVTIESWRRAINRLVSIDKEE